MTPLENLGLIGNTGKGQKRVKIVQTSTNTYQVFGVAPEKIVEQKLEDIFDSFQVETIKSAVTNNNLDSI
ncbi:hypothetical protein HC931_02105 [Candidatus Gracilibacteria bacterium]|nr:hypothetical protein [Candidatus Gracilibacteria bacterium]